MLSLPGLASLSRARVSLFAENLSLAWNNYLTLTPKAAFSIKKAQQPRLQEAVFVYWLT